MKIDFLGKDVSYHLNAKVFGRCLKSESYPQPSMLLTSLQNIVQEPAEVNVSRIDTEKLVQIVFTFRETSIQVTKY